MGLLNLKNRPFNLLLIIAAMSAVLIPFCNGMQMDLHLHDTYYVLNAMWLPAFSCIIALLIWFGFTLFPPKFISRKMISVCLVFLVIPLLLISISPFLYDHFYGNGFAGMPRRYYSYWTIERYESPFYFGELLLIAIGIIMLTLVVLLMNTVIHYFEKT